MNYLFIFFGVLIVALILTTKSVLNMLEKRRMSVFTPFFFIGLLLCLVSGFLFYNFFDLALDIFLIVKFVSIIGMFFVLWRASK